MFLVDFSCVRYSALWQNLALWVSINLGIWSEYSVVWSPCERSKANLTERKNPHAPVNGVKEFVCLW